jgi:hypothetical protein
MFLANCFSSKHTIHFLSDSWVSAQERHGGIRVTRAQLRAESTYPHTLAHSTPQNPIEPTNAVRFTACVWLDHHSLQRIRVLPTQIARHEIPMIHASNRCVQDQSAASSVRASPPMSCVCVCVCACHGVTVRVLWHKQRFGCGYHITSLGKKKT